MTTLSTMRRLLEIGLPTKWIVPVMEVLDDPSAPLPRKRRKRRSKKASAAGVKKAAKKKRRKRRTKAEMESARKAAAK